jgi:hypothetical protein
MWYEIALRKMGEEKELDLNIAVVPHTENADRAIKELRSMLSALGRKDE